MRVGLTIGDSGAGMQLATSILAAYIQRMRTGEGQLIELSMQEAMTYYMRTSIALGSNWGKDAAPRRGNGSSPTINLFPCKPFGQNDYVYIMAVAPRMWTDLCRAIGRPELEHDPKYAEHMARVENIDELIEEITKFTSQYTKHEAMKILAEAGVPCSATFDTKDLYTDPHLIERGFIKEIDHPEQGKVNLLGWPSRMSKSEVEMLPAPQLGKQTNEVLKKDLGLSDADLAVLQKAGVIEYHDHGTE
jgi:formyl-CoA transferase